MRNLKKIVCLLLILMMVISIAIPIVSADPVLPAPGTVLYSEDFETGTAAKRRSDAYADTSKFFGEGRRIEYGGGAMEINYHTGGTKRNFNDTKDLPTIGDENNHLVTLINRTGASEWKGAYKEIIPASAFTGLTNYTVSFKIRTVNPSYYLEKMYGYPGTLGTQTKYEAMVADFSLVRDADTSSKVANHVSFYNWKIWNSNSLLSGGVSTYFENANSYDANGTIGGTMKFVVTAGAGENDATFAIYMNDVLVSTRSDAYSGAPYGMILTLNNYIMQLDDIKVHDDVNDVDTYLEDFEPEVNANVLDGFYTTNANFTGTVVNESTDGHALAWTAKNGYQGSAAAQFAASFAKTADLQGAKQITVSYDATVKGTAITNGYAYFHLGQNEEIAYNSLKGIWVLFYTEAGGDKFQLRVNGTTIDSVTLERYSIQGEKKHYTVAYDSENKTFQMWVGNTKLFNVDLSGEDDAVLNNITDGDVMFGLNGNTSLELDNILVTAGTTLKAEYVGAQTSAAVTDGKYAVRFVGGVGADVDLKDVTGIGFKIVASFNEKQVDYYAQGKGACTSVYGSLLGNAAGVTVTYTADDLVQSYLFALTISGIPESTAVTFRVTPYYTTASGTVNGASYDVVCSNGAIISQTLV